MKNLITKHPSIIRLFKNTIANIPIKEKGVYNRQDPTNFTKGLFEFTYQYSSFRIHYVDCTWSIEIYVEKRINFKWVIIGQFNLDGNELWKRSGSFNGCVKLIIKAFPNILLPDFKSLRQIEEEEYFEDPMGCLADYV